MRDEEAHGNESHGSNRGNGHIDDQQSLGTIAKLPEPFA
jgi:hypothetical protein